LLGKLGGDGSGEQDESTLFGNETIFALSSGPPPAGVAVVRISGPDVRFGLETLVDSVPEPRKASLRLIRGSGERLDRGIVLFFPAPASFTGEDVAELHLHGGRAVIMSVVTELTRLGFRPAEPGEFTRRAFINQRMDLTQVEGLADLVAAETEAQRRQALRQADGSLRDLYESWRARLVRARAMVEAELDFAEEEDVPPSAGAEAWRDLEALAVEIGLYLDDNERGERLRLGAEIVVAGPPNAGKSSLINALARRDVAIVAPEPGTTRDLIEVRLDLGGYPVSLVDTAGLREAKGEVEAEGIRRAEERARAADLVLWLGDMSGAVSNPPGDLKTRVLRVGTKADLVDSDEERMRLAGDFEVAISTVSGEGMETLLAELEGFVRSTFSPGESPLITRARYRHALAACRSSILAARSTTVGAEVVAEELRRATDALGRISGRIDVEDLLDVIFREFCIGK
jgi:tRNA modification GTPase